MKYLDEDIEITVNGFSAPSAGTYVYEVLLVNPETSVGLPAIFVGNCWLALNATSKTFYLNDILNNARSTFDYGFTKYTHTLRITTLSVKLCEPVKVNLTVGGTVYSGTENVYFGYRYPNRKDYLEKDYKLRTLMGNLDSYYILEGNLLPHFPYKMTDNYNFVYTQQDNVSSGLRNKLYLNFEDGVGGYPVSLNRRDDVVICKGSLSKFLFATANDGTDGLVRLTNYSTAYVNYLNDVETTRVEDASGVTYSANLIVIPKGPGRINDFRVWLGTVDHQLVSFDANNTATDLVKTQEFDIDFDDLDVKAMYLGLVSRPSRLLIAAPLAHWTNSAYCVGLKKVYLLFGYSVTPSQIRITNLEIYMKAGLFEDITSSCDILISLSTDIWEYNESYDLYYMVQPSSIDVMDEDETAEFITILSPDIYNETVKHYSGTATIDFDYAYPGLCIRGAATGGVGYINIESPKFSGIKTVRVEFDYVYGDEGGMGSRSGVVNNLQIKILREDYNDIADIAILDACPAKYYLLWQDRYGGFLSQAFSKTETFSEDFNYSYIKSYKNELRPVVIQDTPKWKLNSGWITEDILPYYESIFTSPRLVLYDSIQDKRYDVNLKDTEFIEKTFKNLGRKMFNMQLSLTLNKTQIFIY